MELILRQQSRGSVMPSQTKEFLWYVIGLFGIREHVKGNEVTTDTMDCDA